MRHASRLAGLAFVSDAVEVAGDAEMPAASVIVLEFDHKKAKEKRRVISKEKEDASLDCIRADDMALLSKASQFVSPTEEREKEK